MVSKTTVPGSSPGGPAALSIFSHTLILCFGDQWSPLFFFSQAQSTVPGSSPGGPAHSLRSLLFIIANGKAVRLTQLINSLRSDSRITIYFILYFGDQWSPLFSFRRLKAPFQVQVLVDPLAHFVRFYSLSLGGFTASLDFARKLAKVGLVLASGLVL